MRYAVDAETHGLEVSGGPMRDRGDASGELDRRICEAAHDLRGSLAAIAGQTEHLIDSAGTALPADAQAAVAGLWHGIARMRAMIDALVDAEGGAAASDVVDCDALVAEILHLHARQVAASNATVHVGRLGRVRGEPLHVFRIFQNLIDNALRHAGGGEQPLRVDITSRRVGARRAITIADDGRGMPTREVLAMVTGRAGGEQRRRGLGLSICKGLAELHGGQMWIRSSPEEGTAITVTLPVSAP